MLSVLHSLILLSHFRYFEIGMWHELDTVTLLWKENLIMIDTDIITTQSQLNDM